MKMAQSEAKTKWIKENATFISVKLMRRTEADILEYIEKMGEKGIGKSTLFKLALREYMANHPEEQ